MFSVSEYTDQLALLRSMVAGKFSEIPFDVEVVSSPIIARLLNQLVASIQSYEQENFDESARALFPGWLAIDSRRDEWKAALTFARKNIKPHWDKWDEHERAKVIKDLISPFELDQSSHDEFIREMLK